MRQINFRKVAGEKDGKKRKKVKWGGKTKWLKMFHILVLKIKSKYLESNIYSDDSGYVHSVNILSFLSKFKKENAQIFIILTLIKIMLIVFLCRCNRFFCFLSYSFLFYTQKLFCIIDIQFLLSIYCFLTGLFF